MGEIEHAADTIDQDVAASDQRIDRRQDYDVDDELHRSKLCPATAPARRRIADDLVASLHVVANQSPWRPRSSRRSSAKRDNTARCGNGCPCVHSIGPPRRPLRSTLSFCHRGRILPVSAGQPAPLSAASITMPAIQPSVICSAGYLTCACFAASRDFLVDRQVVLEERVGADDVELPVLDARELPFGFRCAPR